MTPHSQSNNYCAKGIITSHKTFHPVIKEILLTIYLLRVIQNVQENDKSDLFVSSKLVRALISKYRPSGPVSNAGITLTSHPLRQPWAFARFSLPRGGAFDLSFALEQGFCNH